MPKKRKKLKKNKKTFKRKKRNNKKNKTLKKKKILKRKTKIKKRSLKINKDEKSTSEELIFKPRLEWIKSGLANKAQYQKKYNESIKNNNSFWKKEGKRITWIKPYKKIKDVKYSKNEVKIKWFEDGTLNASANCIDRTP